LIVRSHDDFTLLQVDSLNDLVRQDLSSIKDALLFEFNIFGSHSQAYNPGPFAYHVIPSDDASIDASIVFDLGASEDASIRYSDSLSDFAIFANNYVRP
jgi:hypothetical protein